MDKTMMQTVTPLELKPQGQAPKKDAVVGDQLALIRKLERENKELKQQGAETCGWLDQGTCASWWHIRSEIFKIWGIE